MTDSYCAFCFYHSSVVLSYPDPVQVSLSHVSVLSLKPERWYDGVI